MPGTLGRGEETVTLMGRLAQSCVAKKDRTLRAKVFAVSVLSVVKLARIPLRMMVDVCALFGSVCCKNDGEVACVVK